MLLTAKTDKNADRNGSEAVYKKGILLAPHGCSTPRGMAALNNIERLVRSEFSGVPVFTAFTSNFITDKMENTTSPEKALMQIQQDSIRNTVIQSLHLTPGHGYNRILSAARACGNRFDGLAVGTPLLTSSEDVKAFADAMAEILPHNRNRNDAIILMVHGGPDSEYILQQAEQELAAVHQRIFVASLHKKPWSIAQLQAHLTQTGTTLAHLIPMTITAGNHVMNDFIGSGANSWQTRLESAGIKCIPSNKGLGEHDAIAEIFVRHLRRTLMEGAKI